ncbi:hypothetical protein E2L07_19260 [Halalkalibacterium halodurans]|uniref:hypothetical protein n=1 Tax=Halalkalibacterium halodurans TaxID=86665 RepID=UPI001067FAA0|nr:hypothetical protein [Halalkalibacterium halodurans]TES47183.1 hypothetical protein E2L07_19260 [Halalkalibacterium halodurans]
MRLQKANEDNKKCGWTLCPSFLTKIQRYIAESEDCPSLEQIEMTLLAFEEINKKPTEEDMFESMG